MATVTKGKTFINGELVTPAKMHELVDFATVTNIVNADISDSAITDAKLATISTAGKVSNSATTATNASTANAIVARDASGNFSAGRISSSLSISRTGSLIFQDQFGTDFEILGNSTNDKLFIRSGGTDILEIDSTNGFPVWKFPPGFGPSIRFGLGTSSPDPAARLDVSSTNQGFLPPRMETFQRDAISNPPAGLMIYNTSTNKLQVRTNTAWVDLH